MKYNKGFRNLTTRQKLEHVWTYYRGWIIAACFVLLLIGITLRDLAAPQAQLDVLMLNADAETSDTAGFAEFFTLYGYPYYDGAVSLNTNLKFYSEEELSRAEEDAAYRQENSEKELMLSAVAAAGNMELLFGTEEHFFFLAEQGLLMDLRAVLSEELLSQYAGQLIYIQEEGQSEYYPCAVEWKQNPWLAENGYYSGNCFFGVMYLADNPEMASNFAEFLLKYSADKAIVP